MTKAVDEYGFAIRTFWVVTTSLKIARGWSRDRGQSEKRSEFSSRIHGSARSKDSVAVIGGKARTCEFDLTIRADTRAGEEWALHVANTGPRKDDGTAEERIRKRVNEVLDKDPATATLFVMDDDWEIGIKGGWSLDCQIPAALFDQLEADIAQNKAGEAHFGINWVAGLVRDEHAPPSVATTWGMIQINGRPEPFHGHLTSATWRVVDHAAARANPALGVARYDRVRRERLSWATQTYSAERHSQIMRLAEEFVDLSIRESNRLGEDEASAESRINDALDLLSNFRNAVNDFSSEREPNKETEAGAWKEWRIKQGVVWHHLDPEAVLYGDEAGEKLRKVDKAEVGDVAARYLQRPWLEHGWFEWMLLDVLLYAEIVAFGVDWKSRAPSSEGYHWLSAVTNKGDLRAMRKYAARQRFLLATADVGILFVAPAIVVLRTSRAENMPWWYYVALAWVIFYGAVKLLALVRRLVKGPTESPWDKGWRLWQAMRGVYNRLPNDSVVSPTEIRKELDRIAAEGAAWPGPAYAIVDHAIRRNPAVWILNPRSAYSAV